MSWNLPPGVTLNDVDPPDPDIQDALEGKTNADLRDILDRNCIHYDEDDDLREAVINAYENGALQWDDI